MTYQFWLTANIKWQQSILKVLHQNTNEMPVSSTSSSPQHSCVRLDPSNKCHVLPIPSTSSPIPSFLTLPHACSDVEHPPRNLNTAKMPNSSSSPLTAASETDLLPPSSLSSSLLSPPADIPEICYCVNTVRQNKNGTSICNSDQKLYFTPEISHTRMSPPFINYQ